MTNNFKKFGYLGVTNVDLPKPWEPAVMQALTKVDCLVKPKYIPRFFLNFLKKKFPKYLKKIIGNTEIHQIKQKFATLKISGTYSDDIKRILTIAEVTCKNTCEFCGNTNTTHVMVKSWVRNLCATCKEVKTNGIIS